MSKNVNTLWKGMWLAIVEEIWKHRNIIVFSNGVVYVIDIFALAQLNA